MPLRLRFLLGVPELKALIEPVARLLSEPVSGPVSGLLAGPVGGLLVELEPDKGSMTSGSDLTIKRGSPES